uniref:EF-hand domain-containing protein n=1 Tax=Strigamia maritima TaxID=126957 RepID=T1J2C3_STRMM
MAAGGGPTAFDNVFQQFAKHGDPKSKGDEITLANIDKWLKQANMMGKKFTNTDTSSAFKHVAKTKGTLTEREFVEFLEAISKGKGISAKELQDTLTASGPPTSSPTTSSAGHDNADDADNLEVLSRLGRPLDCGTCCDDGGSY